MRGDTGEANTECIMEGKYSAGPNCGVGNHEIEKLSILADRNLEVLRETLNPRQTELLITYTDCVDSCCSLLSSQAFCEGFCLAAQLLAEALVDRP